MASRLTWLDYSDHERRKVLEVIDLFHEEETRDELGIGSIRDSFADQLFPGTSTIQTRARYFLFIPWIYRALESKRIAPPEVELLQRREEVRLMDQLADSEDTHGVIGKQSRDSLKRLPSSVYWAGLSKWGLRKFEGSQEDYRRHLSSSVAFEKRRSRRDDGELLLSGSESWHTDLPAPPPDFPLGASFDLTREEADYLTDRVRSTATSTMIAVLLESGDQTECDYPWEHPQMGTFPEHIREQLLHADQFSLALHGAALLYNLMLAEKSNWQVKIDEYRELLQDWWLLYQDSQQHNWERKRFWELARTGVARIPARTSQFVDRWLDQVEKSKQLVHIVDSQNTRALISEREFQLKRSRARLHNPRALENWKGKSGTARMDYRWFSAEVIINDILRAKGR